MDKQWTDRLPELLEGYTEAEPEGLWDAVQAGLSPVKRRIPAAWWLVAGGLLAAASVALVVFLRPARTASPIRAVVPGNALVQGPVLSPVPPSSRPMPMPPRVQNQPETPPTEPEMPVREQNGPETPQSEPETPPAAPETPPAVTETLPEPQQVLWPEEPRRVSALAVQLSLSGSGFPGQAATASTSGYGLPASAGFSMQTKSASEDAAYSRMLSRNRASTTEVSHSQWAKVSLGVAVGIGPRWQVETGLVYSLLQSTATSLAGVSEVRATRNLHYLGIPLHLKFRPFIWNRISLYAFAGPMYEFSMAASTRTDLSLNGKVVSTETDRTNVPDRRWSLNAGVGLQWHLFNRSILFVQPGVSWHIPNHSGVECFYSEHPWAFDFTFGYRILLFGGNN